MGAVEHQAGDFLDGEAAGQVDSPFIGRPAPVFIRVEFSVPVEVLEGTALHGKDRSRGVAQRRAFFLDDQFETVRLLFLPLRTAGADQDDQHK